MLDAIKEHAVKAIIAVLITVSASLYHFIAETQTRLAILEYRVNYQLPPAPWTPKGTP